MKKITFLATAILLLSSNLFAQSKQKDSGILGFTRYPLVVLPPTVHTYRSSISIAGRDAGIAGFEVGELVPNGKSSPMMGAEMNWEDKRGEFTNTFLAIDGLREGDGGLEVKLEFGKWIQHHSEQGAQPYGKSPGGRNLYDYRYIYGIDERLTVTYNNQTLLDTVLGTGADQKNFNYHECDCWISGNSTYYTAIENENLTIFPKVKAILSDYFGKSEFTADIAIMSLKGKEFTTTDSIKTKLIAAFDSLSWGETDDADVQAIATQYEDINKGKLGKIEKKNTEILLYNIALCYYLLGDFDKARFTLSIEEKNIKANKGANFLKGVASFGKDLVAINVSVNGERVSLTELGKSMFGKKEKAMIKINTGAELYKHIVETQKRHTANNIH